MASELHLSERRACPLVVFSRESYRNPLEVDKAAQVRLRFGYRRLYVLMLPEIPSVNHERV